MEIDLRPLEETVTAPAPDDAGLVFIGRIRTPWTGRGQCPRQGRAGEGPLCRVEIDPLWAPALAGLDDFGRLELLYWLDRARRDLMVQNPGHSGATGGTFSIRSPNRPNPIGTAEVTLEGREGCTLLVRGLDCLDGTPLLDVKPARRQLAEIDETGTAGGPRHCVKG